MPQAEQKIKKYLSRNAKKPANTRQPATFGDQRLESLAGDDRPATICGQGDTEVVDEPAALGRRLRQSGDFLKLGLIDSHG